MRRREKTWSQLGRTDEDSGEWKRKEYNQGVLYKLFNKKKYKCNSIQANKLSLLTKHKRNFQREVPKAPSWAEELLAVDGFWGKEGQFSLGRWPLLYTTPSLKESTAFMCLLVQSTGFYRFSITSSATKDSLVSVSLLFPPLVLEL